MSLMLALGSPSLITYSLSLTILNRFWIRQRFASLRSECRAVIDRHPQFVERIKAAQYLLQEAQQVPMRASQEGGWLSSLVVLNNNQRWWIAVKKDLRNTRRGVTFSLVAQVGMAVTAWLFTIIAAFVGNLGDINTALQISSGAIWLWMVSHASSCTITGRYCYLQLSCSVATVSDSQSGSAANSNFRFPSSVDGSQLEHSTEQDPSSKLSKMITILLSERCLTETPMVTLPLLLSGNKPFSADQVSTKGLT